MELLEYLTLAVAAGGVWLWLDSLKTREIGIRAAQAACREDGLQFLDETVAGKSLGFARDEDGHLRLKRVYIFEYSDTGDNRREGSVTLLGDRVEFLHLRPHLYVVPRTDDTHETLH